MEILRSLSSPSQCILAFMMICMVIGALDALLGNRFGLGSRFEAGFSAFGSIAVSMIGIIALVPFLEKCISSGLVPVFEFLGADPAILAGMTLACDMGGYQLAQALAVSPEAVGLGGMLLASVLGVNIVFNIPVALRIIAPEKQPAMVRGILCGLITLPFGCFAGALAAGYPLLWTAKNLLPVLAISLLLALLLWKAPRFITKVFLIFGKLINAAALCVTVVVIAQEVLGLTPINGLDSVWTGMKNVCAVILVLPGACVMVELLSRLLKKPFEKISGLLHVNPAAAFGLLTSLANAVPTFEMSNQMDDRGVTLNFAFLVSAGYVLGDHLAFCGAFDSSLILPMIVCKLTGGLLALLLSLFATSPRI